ncbi:MAG: PcfJ domain-containing protein, partial [Bacteroidota bacterium]
PQIAGNVHCEDFWVEMIHFMNRACNGRYENLRRLIHYVRRVKFSRRRMYDRHQGIRYLPPEKPHFSFKGRNWEKLQEEMMQWEDIQARNGQAFKSSLVASIDDFLQEGQLDHQVGSFHIKPLLTEREILEEGRSMSHCVGSYGHLVKAGNTSIWSLSFTKRGHGSPKRLLTLEVSKGHRIIQSKGKANRPPTQLEETLVKKWALQQGLTYASW